MKIYLYFCNQIIIAININLGVNTKNRVKDRLLEFRIKPSLQRMAIMEYLMSHLTYPTADSIFNDLYSLIPTLSKTTVYNTLKRLESNILKV